MGRGASEGWVWRSERGSDANRARANLVWVAVLIGALAMNRRLPIVHVPAAAAAMRRLLLVLILGGRLVVLVVLL